MASQITSTGVVRYIRPRHGTMFDLEEIRAAIGGGHFDIVHFRKPTSEGYNIMIVDDEGLLKDYPVNWKATLLYRLYRGQSDTPIVGDVLLAKFPEEID